MILIFFMSFFLVIAGNLGASNKNRSQKAIHLGLHVLIDTTTTTAATTTTTHTTTLTTTLTLTSALTTTTTTLFARCLINTKSSTQGK